MNTIDHYIHAATRANTRKAYQAAVQHFEVEWGGFLPATADSVAQYLADHAETLAINTLKQRLAGLAQWHIDQGFPDPTKASLVKKVLKGIRELHPTQEKQAKPFQIEQLRQLIQWIDLRLSEPLDESLRLRLIRDRALVLLGFWRGFRSDEICRAYVEHMTLQPGQGMTLYVPRSKGDRQAQGRTYKTPALQTLCPVDACQAWLDICGLTTGPLFRSVDRWGNLSEQALHANSVIPLLRDLFARAELPDPESYSSHSLRRGFATWAHASGWDMKALMEYVGWKDVKSAMRYIDVTTPFDVGRVDTTSDTVMARLEKTSEDAQWQETRVDLHLAIERYHSNARGMKKTREHIERICLKTYQMRCLAREKGHYRLTLRHESPEHLDRILGDMLTEMQHIADSHHCFIEAYFEDLSNGRRWD